MSESPGQNCAQGGSLVYDNTGVQPGVGWHGLPHLHALSGKQLS